MLKRRDFEAGVSEYQTRFAIQCTYCKRHELRGALPSMLDLDADVSPTASRLRASCKVLGVAPCQFVRRAGVQKLDHAGAVSAGLVDAAPILRLRGDDGEAMYAVKLDMRARLEAASIPELAKMAFETLGESADA